MALGVATFALVILMNGWIDGGPAARGNAIDHIPGFTSIERCNKAGEMVRNASIKPETTKTACVETLEPVGDPQDDVYVLAVLISGWADIGSGAQGNAIDFIPGYASAKQCETIGEKIRDISSNKSTIKTVCVQL